MSATAVIGDLLKPSSLIVSAPEVCDCCRRDLYIVSGEKVLCADCSRTAESGKQLWKCQNCGTYRVWGLDSPVETSLKRLNCLACEEITPHCFLYVTRAGRSSR